MTECPGTVWMVTDAASPTSQMAAAMSGFVLAGMIVLLSQPGANKDNDDKQTALDRVRPLLPFVATFITMGLTSYAFALIAGERADSCRRVWTAAVVGSGMLAIGAVATVCGLMLLLRAYLVRNHLQKGPLDDLDRVLKLTLLLLTVVTTFLLLQRTYEYLVVWYGGELPARWLWLVAMIVVLELILILAVIAVIMPKQSKKLKDESLSRYRRIRCAGCYALLYAASSVTVIYAIVGTAMVGVALGVVPDWSDAPGAVAWTVAASAVAFPLFAVVAYAYAAWKIDDPEQSAAPLEQSAAPLEQSAAPLEQSAAPLEQSAAPLEQSAAPLVQGAAPLEQVRSTGGLVPECDARLVVTARNHSQVTFMRVVVATVAVVAVALGTGFRAGGRRRR